jgi:predicted RNase H-like HicB family nuclease
MTDTQLKSTVTVGISRSEGCYVASFVEIAAVTQARTFDELVHNLREIVHLHLEDEDPADFGLATKNPSIVMIYELEPANA